MSALIGPDIHSPDRTQQQLLASQLVACLGRESAIHVCKVNGWDGILAAILRDVPERQDIADAAE